MARCSKNILEVLFFVFSPLAHLINKRRAEKSIIIPLVMAKVLIVTNFILIMLGELRFMDITGRGLENAFSYDTQEKWVM